VEEANGAGGGTEEDQLAIEQLLLPFEYQLLHFVGEGALIVTPEIRTRRLVCAAPRVSSRLVATLLLSCRIPVKCLVIYKGIAFEDCSCKVAATKHQEPPLLALGQTVQCVNTFATLLLDG
jgi:hypothetical protein